MRIYYVTSTNISTDALIKYKRKNAMVSYFYIRETADKRSLMEKIQGTADSIELPVMWKNYLKQFDSVMVDSGAYTYQIKSGMYMDKQKAGIDLTSISFKKLDEFTEQYGQWLAANKDHFDYYVEMDVDKLVGLPKVEEYRNYLETCTSKQCIPVWHSSRGFEYWDKMITDYKYVAIGGVAANEMTNSERKISYLISLAHKKNCKVHGMGFTKFRYLNLIPFDTVDSSTWLSGARHGQLQLYIDKTIKGILLRKHGKDSRKVGYKEFYNVNLDSWSLYEKYLEDYWSKQESEEEVLLNE